MRVLAGNKKHAKINNFYMYMYMYI